MTVIALSGQPNTGKSTLFNQLTGARQKVANFPGVTVEKKEGFFSAEGKLCQIVDLPGLYSLDSTSLDEHIASSFVLGTLPGVAAPERIAIVINSLTLERGLYLISQFQDLDIPVVVVLNMMDTAQKSGRQIDLQKLSKVLNVPVVATVASRGEGVAELKQTLVTDTNPVQLSQWPDLPKAVQKVLNKVEVAIEKQGPQLKHRRYWARQVIAHYARYGKLNPEKFPFDVYQPALVNTLEIHTLVLKNAWEILSQQRHTWAQTITDLVVKTMSVKKKNTPQAVTNAIDAVVLNPWAGPLIFLFVMGALFQSIFTWAVPVMDLIAAGVGWVGQMISAVVPSGLLQSFLVDGVVAGAGNVFIFLPQIMMLFGIITILEDSGYLSRASFLLDRLLVRTGMSGKGFIPLLSSFACAIPGIMATRSIEDRKERLITIMVAPLMTCSARLPVYALLIAAFIPAITIGGILNLQGLTFLALYVLGIVGAGFAAWVMKRVWMKKNKSFYVAELPLYRMPNWKNVLHVMIQRGKIFILKAGKIILFCTVVLWFLAAFPRHENLPQGEALKQSYIGQLGHVIEPVIQPLGFDWKIGIGLISAFAAREVMVSTMGTLYSMSDVDETSVSLKSAMQRDQHPDGRPVFTLAVAMSLLVFFVFAMQCMSTLAITRRETNSWKIPVVMFTYMLVLAYAASWATYVTVTYFSA